jgi:hypothetical protein
MCYVERWWLVARYGDGSARVYGRNSVDVRAAGAQFVGTLRDACEILARRDGTKLLVPIPVAQEIIPGTIFAEAV